MLCCKINLPEAFGWKIKALGKCMELLDGLQNIMQLTQCSECTAEMIVMPRSYYDSLPKNEYSGWQIFYSRKVSELC